MANHKLLLRVAKLQHKENKNQGEILAILREEGLLKGTGTSNTTGISRLQDEAGSWLIDEYEASSSLREAIQKSAEEKLALDLCAKYGLLRVLIVPGGKGGSPADYTALMKLYGKIAATYLDELCDQALEERKQLFVGVSGGQSILDMVNSLIDRPRSNVHFYAAAMIGRGSSMATSHVGPEVNATIAWARSGRFTRQLFYGTVPPYSASRELGDARDEKHRHTLGRKEILKQARILRQTDDVQSALQEMNRNINVAIAGLGLPTEDAKLGSKHVQRITMTGLLKPLGIDPTQLAEEGAIGDISYNLYDDQGNGNPNWRFFLTAGDGSKFEGVDFYRNMVRQKQPVIVMAGMRKERALIPALAGKLFNVLVTDVVTAEMLLTRR